MTTAHINRIATANPQHDVHDTFIDFAAHSVSTDQQISGSTARNKVDSGELSNDDNF
jgi:hypothetical protein